MDYQPALIIFKLESTMRLFLRPPSGQFKRHAAVVASFVYLFVFVCGGAHTRQHSPALCSSRSLEIAADCLTESCTCGFHSPAFLSGKCVCPAHGTILRSHCHTDTDTKMFWPLTFPPSTPCLLKVFLPPKQTQILRKQIETETGTQTQI